MLAFFALLQLSGAPDTFLNWLDSIAQNQLAQRSAKIQAVRTKEQAEQRKAEVRSKILDLIGGLPQYDGPLNARTTGTLKADGYTIEKVIFDSLPQYRITANLYVPSTSGRHPAVLFSIGHWDQGKPAAQLIAGNLARKGFVVLAYDPVGQGERQQSYDWRTGRSLAGGATEQHFMAGPTTILLGQAFSRYMIWDSKRAIDYLVSRPEVNADRIGATGCSGGGTQTTYISALDPRIQAAAPACYMNSFQVLFKGPVGDSEQSLPGFLSSGLDQTDYVELFAPKPWLISSTEQDFFTPAGAKVVYEEARAWYRIYDVEQKVKWVVGPGGHGTPLPVREAIYDWFIQWLNDGKGTAKEEAVSLFNDFELWVTPKGHLTPETSRDLYEIIKEDLHKQHTPSGNLKTFLQQLVPPPDSSAPAPQMTLLKAAAETSKGVILVQTAEPPSARAKELAAAGEHVLVVVPRGLPVAGTQNLSSDWITNTRAWLTGSSLPAIRARDILTAVDHIGKEAGVKTIRAEASETAGYWLLMAAALDPRIASIRIERMPYSIRSAFETPIHRGLHDVAIRGFARSWDTPDLFRLISPRPVELVDPTDWMRNRIPAPPSDPPIAGLRIEYTKFGH